MRGHTLKVSSVTRLHGLDPRRSLVAAISWLVIALAACFALADNIVQQHARRLALETDQLGSDLGQAILARRNAIKAAGAISASPQEVFAELQRLYPQLGWIAMAPVLWFGLGPIGLGYGIAASILIVVRHRDGRCQR